MSKKRGKARKSKGKGKRHRLLQAHARAFLASFAEHGIVLLAAQHAGVERVQHYRWLENLPGYAEDFAKAKETAADRLEQEARRRAVEGLKRYRFDKAGRPLLHPETGQPYFEHEYSDTLLLAMLKAKRPDQYRERQSIEHTGANGGPIETHDLSGLTTQELRDMREIYRRAHERQDRERSGD